MRIKDRPFGVEFEVSATYAVTEKVFKKFAKVATLRGDRVQMINSYYKSDGYTWDLKKDASTGAEVCTPRITLNGYRRISLMMILLDELRKNCYVTNSDGLHVHVNIADMAPLERVDLLWNWVKFEKLFVELFPPARRKNRFAEQYLPKMKRYFNNNDELDFNNACGKLVKLGENHYSIVNITSIPSIEFRVMEGTLSDVDILNWIELCIRFVDKTKAFYRKNKRENLHISELKNPDVDELVDLCAIKPHSTLDKWIKYRKLKIELDNSIKSLKPIGASH